MENKKVCGKCGSTEFYEKNKNRCKQCNKQKCKDYKAKNRNKIQDYNVKYKKENRESIRVYERKMAKTNINYKIAKNCRCRIWNALQNKNLKKNNRTHLFINNKAEDLIK